MKKIYLSPLLAGLTACASVSVVEEQENVALAPRVMPTTVFVRPFVVRSDAEFDAAQMASEVDSRPRIGREVVVGIESRGERWLTRTQLLEPGEPVPAEGLLVEGQLARVRQGSRTLRISLGFGLGRSHMDSIVRVYNLGASRDMPWLMFKTTGGSNMEPGLLPGLVVPSPVTVPIVATALGGAAGGVSLGQKGVTEDARRTGRVVAAKVHDRLVERGLIERRTHPKRAGRVRTLIGEVVMPETD